MGSDQEDRREIEAYLDQHHLQAFIGDAVNDVVKERPQDPLVKLADALRACSDASRQIQKVQGRQILNGEGLPALEVEIRTGQVSLSNLLPLATTTETLCMRTHRCSNCSSNSPPRSEGFEYTLSLKP